MLALLNELCEKKAKLSKRVEESWLRVEQARSKVQAEEESLGSLEKDLEGVGNQIEAHRKEEKEKGERQKREEAQEVGGGDMDDDPLWRKLTVLRR